MSSDLSFLSRRGRGRPGAQHLQRDQRGVTSEKGGIVPHYMGVENKNGRIVTSSRVTATWATPGNGSTIRVSGEIRIACLQGRDQRRDLRDEPLIFADCADHDPTLA